MDIEKQIDSVLEQEQTARDEEARAAVRVRVVEQERIRLEEQKQAEIRRARAAYLERAEAAHQQACAEYKVAVDAFCETRIKLQALDIILGRSGFGHSLGIELRHSTAAPDVADVNDGLRAAVDSLRKNLGG